MTRPSALVLDGNEVKLRLEAERARTKSPVHVDWVRFTVIRRNAPFLPVDYVLPRYEGSIWDEVRPGVTYADDLQAKKIAQVLREIPDGDFDAAAQALDLAQTVADAMGPDYAVAPEQRKGHDFYRYRWAIERNGAECGWVGYLSSGDSPRQKQQSRTLHCNLFGAACTFAAPGWNDRLASIIEDRKGDVTRCDLALDFFDGFDGGMEAVKADYMAGLCDVGGRRLKCNMVGDWANGHERSFYFGSKEAGKQTNVYEKGDQLFGVEAESRWLRAELRYGNKLRILSPEMLRRPADFFAGASDWHALMLARADAMAPVVAEPVKTTPRLALETVEAEAVRSLRWFNEVAAPTCAALWDHVGDAFLEFVTNKKAPGRMRHFSHIERARGYAAALLRSSTVGGACPALA
jgi:phage replication initiation protein